MNVTDASQIVVDPNDDLTEALQFRLEELSYSINTNRRTQVKLWFGSAVHWLGIHTFVRHMRYDPSSDALVDVGRVCMYCSVGMRQ
jgi:hypothetical protein